MDVDRDGVPRKEVLDTVHGHVALGPLALILPEDETSITAREIRRHNPQWGRTWTSSPPEFEAASIPPLPVAVCSASRPRAGGDALRSSAS